MVKVFFCPSRKSAPERSFRPQWVYEWPLSEVEIRYDCERAIDSHHVKYFRKDTQEFFMLSFFCDMTCGMTKQETNTSQDLPLELGEHVIWEEQPVTSAYVKQRYGKLTAIGVILLGVIFFGVQEIFIQDDAPDFSISSDESLSVLITFVVLTLIGGVLATSMLWGRKEAENTYFYLTNKKLMILSGVSPPQILVYPPQSLTHLDTIITKNGTGTLYFREEKPFIYGGLYKKKIGFEGIRDPGSLYGLIHKVFYT